MGARLGLVLFGGLLAILVVGFAAVRGIGAPTVQSGDVAIVEGAPEGLGEISEAEFNRALMQQVGTGSIASVPKPGDKEYDAVKEAALSGLLTAIWLQGQAEEIGISISDKQVEGEQIKLKGEFPSPRAYREFVEAGHYTKHDLYERAKVEFAAAEIQASILEAAPKPTESEIELFYEAEKAGQFKGRSLAEARAEVVAILTQAKQSESLEKFDSVHESKWESQTYCASEFEIAICANYDEAHSAIGALPACYQGGRLPAKGCPAPVIQVRPAVPGSVSPIEPKGERLPQRPMPERFGA
jgi:SurA N-terminal domain